METRKPLRRWQVTPVRRSRAVCCGLALLIAGCTTAGSERLSGPEPIEPVQAERVGR